MGILGLAKLIGDLAPAAVKDNEIKNYFGRKIAIDASMSIYQFLIAVRQEGNVLTDSSGETTSHLLGLFYRTIRMMENGIKPVYVFDGKPPEMKAGELNKRQERREEAKKELEKAEEDGNAENINKFSRRLVKVTRQHNDECKRLLTLMGVPYIEAPGEAEAQCAAMVKTGKVFALATEDMDGLTFGANVLLRHLTFSEARKMPIQEFHHERILSELEFSESQFIDLCILLGCDYCDSIRGIGPKRAVELIRQHKSLEGVLKHIDKSKYTVPDDWPYEEVRRLFKEPDVLSPEKVELKWTEPNEEELIKFLCEEKSFGEDRVKNGVKKMLKSRSSQTQGRLDNFFKITPAPGGTKRKAETVDDKKKSKKKPGRKPK